MKEKWEVYGSVRKKKMGSKRNGEGKKKKLGVGRVGSHEEWGENGGTSENRGGRRVGSPGEWGEKKWGGGPAQMELGVKEKSGWGGKMEK